MGWDTGIKNMQDAIKGYSEIMANQAKIQGEMAVNQLKAKDNWLYKMQALKEQGGLGETPQVSQGTDVFSEKPQPEVRAGATGPYLHYPNPKQYIFSRIQEKVRRGMATTQERKWMEKYLDDMDMERYGKERTPISKNPNFQEGGGIKALLNPNVAQISPETQQVIDNIKTEGDLDELLDKRDEYAAAGVDIDAILEYFGKR